MEKKTVVIIGGGGLGTAIAEKFLGQGWRIFLLSKTDRNLFPGREFFQFLNCDIRDEAEVSKALAQILKTAISLDALVHTAVADVSSKKFFDLSAEEFKRHFEVDVFGGFNVFKQAGQIMKRQSKGSIVGLSTLYTEPNINQPSLPGYVSAKFALRGMLRELAKELAPYQVRVNAVAPGVVPTGLNAMVPKRAFEFLQEKNPMKSLVSAEDAANVVYFLCTEEASSLTGLHIPVAYGEGMTL